MVTGSKNAEVLKNATNYLKFDTLFYFVTAVICVVRNAMQGLGDHITPLVSSSLGNDRQNRDCSNTRSVVWLHRCNRGGTTRMVYYGHSSADTDFPHAGFKK